MRRYSIPAALFAIPLLIAAVSAQNTAPAKHSFGPQDWAPLRSAGVDAVSPDGTILYTRHLRRRTRPHPPGMVDHRPRRLARGEARPARRASAHGLHPRRPQPLRRLESQPQSPVRHLPHPRRQSRAGARPRLSLLPRGIGLRAPRSTRQAVRPRRRPASSRSARRRPPCSRARPIQPLRRQSRRHRRRVVVPEPEDTSPAASSCGGGAGAGPHGAADSHSLAVLSASAAHRPPRRQQLHRCLLRHRRPPRHRHSELRHRTSRYDPRTMAAHSPSSPPNPHVLTPEHVYTVPAAGGTAEDRTPGLDATADPLAGDVQRPSSGFSSTTAFALRSTNSPTASSRRNTAGPTASSPACPSARRLRGRNPRSSPSPSPTPPMPATSPCRTATTSAESPPKATPSSPPVDLGPVSRRPLEEQRRHRP